MPLQLVLFVLMCCKMGQARNLNFAKRAGEVAQTRNQNTLFKNGLI